MEQLDRVENYQTQQNISAFLPKKTVFVVEDDASIREFLVGYLEDNGYWVKSARNGREAISKLRATASPSVFLVDAMMPEMNGYELTQWLRADSTLSEVPIVMMSAFKKLDANVEWDEFIPKPFDLNDLEARIKRYCYQPPKKLERKTPLKLAATDTTGFLTTIRESPELIFILELFLLAAVTLIVRSTQDFVH